MWDVKTEKNQTLASNKGMKQSAIKEKNKLKKGKNLKMGTKIP